MDRHPFPGDDWLMLTTRRLGLSSPCVSGALLALPVAKNGPTHYRPIHMRVLGGRPAPGGGRRTGMINLRGLADQPGCGAGGVSIDIPGSPVDPASPCCGVATTPPSGIGREAAHRRSHAALSAFARRACPATKTPAAASGYNASCRPFGMHGKAIGRIEARRGKIPAYLVPSGGGGLAARSGSDCVLPSTEAAGCIRNRFPGRGLGAAAAARAGLEGREPRRPRGRDGSEIGRPSTRGPVACTECGRIGHRGSGLRHPRAAWNRSSSGAGETSCAGARPARGMRASARRGGDAR